MTRVFCLPNQTVYFISLLVGVPVQKCFVENIPCILPEIPIKDLNIVSMLPKVFSHSKNGACDNSTNTVYLPTKRQYNSRHWLVYRNIFVKGIRCISPDVIAKTFVSRRHPKQSLDFFQFLLTPLHFLLPSYSKDWQTSMYRTAPEVDTLLIW